MSENSKISWTDATWNPTLGCERESPGCAGCYAVKEVNRMAGNPNPKISSVNSGLVHKLGNGKLDWTGEITTVPDRLQAPLRWKSPRRIFVNSLSDLFHPKVQDAFIDAVFATMAIASQHTYQILTKHPGRMAAYFSDLSERDMAIGQAVIDHFDVMFTGDPECVSDDFTYFALPLPNVWLGTSVENQEYADKRIPHLLRTPAAVRFLSCEPLLGPINLETLTGRFTDDEAANTRIFERLIDGIGWVIVGGESGPGARDFDIAWARIIQEQCKTAGVPYFLKQMGSNAIGKITSASESAVRLNGGRWLLDKKGADPNEWPEGMRVRQFPEVAK